MLPCCGARQHSSAMNYRTTIKACFAGYIVQAIVNSFAPLLFAHFNEAYGIPLSRISMLAALNFSVQLASDAVAARIADRIGYRPMITAAHIFSAAGFALLAILPDMIDPFTAVAVSISVYAIGGGLLEVLLSPIMESCPTENKEKAMSLLHSFYCWGSAAVVLLSTLFFHAFGIGKWKILAFLWAIIPIANGMIFLFTPLAKNGNEGYAGMQTARSIFRTPAFWLFLLVMFAAGACEMSIAQWASVFAEEGLGISKAAGDLAGPLAFAVLMGTVRAVCGKRGTGIALGSFMIISASLCAIAYIIASSPLPPVINLSGCALCGLSVGIMWPGTFSMASSALRGGGTAVFAFLALAGDIGCAAGPLLVGIISDAAGGSLKAGIAAAIIFPLSMIAALAALRRKPERAG